MNWSFCESGVNESHIRDSVERLRDSCLFGCMNLSCVVLDESSSLKLIGKAVFVLFGVCELHISEIVKKLCNECFSL